LIKKLQLTIIKPLILFMMLYEFWAGVPNISYVCSSPHNRYKYNRIGGVLVRVLSPRALDRVFEPYKKTIKMCICCFSAKHSALRRKSKDWLARNESEWGDMSVSGMLFQWASTMQIQLSVLV